MTDKTAKIPLKRMSKGQRKHIRRLKQAGLKPGPAAR
jgi:hypothetical protein